MFLILFTTLNIFEILFTATILASWLQSVCSMVSDFNAGLIIIINLIYVLVITGAFIDNHFIILKHSK